MFEFTGIYNDYYNLKIAQVYFLKGKMQHRAIYDYFFRTLPFNGGYAIFAGLDDFLSKVENIHFNTIDKDFLKQKNYNSDFIRYLGNFRFKGKIYSVPEGEIIFPYCPILIVEANLIEAQLLETLLLNLLNFQTLIATKATRIRQIAGDRELIDFGLRRAQCTGAYYASRSAIIGGFNGSSNVNIGKKYREISLLGTMSHSFIQSYDSELIAFRDFANVWTESCIFLVDTYNTLKSGVPNAIKIAKEMEKKGFRIKGIRIDSGDLSYLSKKSRKMLDDQGLHYVKIAVSNQLDEDIIKSLLDKQSPIDIFGVGTNLSVGNPDSYLDGVYKLSCSENKPRIKISDNIYKINFPCKKQVYRIIDNVGNFLGMDAISLYKERNINYIYDPFNLNKKFSIKKYKKIPLLKEVMCNGKRLCTTSTLTEIANYVQNRLSHLPIEYKKTTNPTIYNIGLSTKLNNIRTKLIKLLETKYIK